MCQGIAQARGLVPRAEAEAVADDDRLQVGIRQRCQDGVLETVYMQHFIDKGIVVAAQAPQFLPVALGVRRVHGRNRQHFEVGAIIVVLIERWREVFRQGDIDLLARLPHLCVVPIRAGRQSAVDSLRERGKPGGVAVLQPLLQRAHQPRSWKGEKVFQRQDVCHCTAGSVDKGCCVLSPRRGSGPGSPHHGRLRPVVRTLVGDRETVGKDL